VESKLGVKKNEAKEDLGDTELIRLVEKGDEDAFLALYRRHQGAIFRFSLHMSGCREMAEEATQEVFMSLLSESRLYAPGRGPLQAYLIGIARNKVRRQLALSRAWASDLSVAEEGISLLEGLNKEQELAALRNAILSLPPNYREVIVLCDLENQDYSQTALQLGCPVGTIRSRLHRARAILGAKLRKTQGCPA
jgi:RNA polymerase sigma-70 factor (ECF subfamily)